jgi:hypothetical protein
VYNSCKKAAKAATLKEPPDPTETSLLPTDERTARSKSSMAARFAQAKVAGKLLRSHQYGLPNGLFCLHRGRATLGQGYVWESTAFMANIKRNAVSVVHSHLQKTANGIQVVDPIRESGKLGGSPFGEQKPNSRVTVMAQFHQNCP